MGCDLFFSALLARHAMERRLRDVSREATSLEGREGGYERRKERLCCQLSKLFVVFELLVVDS